MDDTTVRQARALVPALSGLARVLRVRGVDEAGLMHLPASEVDVLRYVLGVPGASVGAVAHDLGLRSSNVSSTVRALVARGLLVREPDPDDGRCVRLQPTKTAVHGMALLEDAWAQLFAAALAELPDADQAALAAAVPALTDLARRLGVQHADPATRRNGA